MSGWIVQRLVNANPGLKVNRKITFSSTDKCFLLLCFMYMVIIKTEGQQYTENLTAKSQN